MLGLWGSWQSHAVALGATVNVEPWVGFSSTISIFFFFSPWPRKALTWTFNWWGGTVYKRPSGILSRSDLYVSSTYLKTARSCTLASSSFSLLFFFCFSLWQHMLLFLFFFQSEINVTISLIGMRLLTSQWGRAWFQAAYVQYALYTCKRNKGARRRRTVLC